jgi:hypothetical protein
VTAKTNFWPPRWLAVVFVLMVALAAAYGLWWRHAAGILEQNLTAIGTQGAAQGVTAKWDALAFSGFPLRLRASLDKPLYVNAPSRFRWTAGRLHVELLPWSVSHFVLRAEGPQELRFGDMSLEGQAAASSISLKLASGGEPEQFDIGAEKPDVALKRANGAPAGFKGELAGFHWRLAPGADLAKGRADHDIAVNGRALTLSGVELPFGPDIQDLQVQLTLVGVPLPTGPNDEIGLNAWRLQGAPVKVRKLSFVSGGVDVSGAGELGLTADGFVQGEIGLMVGGLDKIVQLLTARGAVAPEARTALNVTATMIAATGAKAPLPLIFKDGQTYLGPARIGPAPRIVF